MCDTPKYENIRQVLVHLYIESQSSSLMCVIHLNTWLVVFVHLYRVTVRLFNVCDTLDYVARSLGSSVYRVTVNLSNMCVAHLKTWIEGKSWFICI